MIRRTAIDERLLYNDLVAFHALVDAENINQLEQISPSRLRKSLCNLRYEAAWALLRSLITDQSDPDSSDEQGERQEISRLHAFFSVCLSLHDFLEYLDRFPSGARVEVYRKDRVECVRRWFPHIHPDPVLLNKFLLRRLPTELHDGVEAHVTGGYNCVPCRQALERLRPSNHLERWAPAARLAASSTQMNDSEWDTQLKVNGVDRSYTLRYLDEGGYLRVFLFAKEEGNLSRVVFRLTLTFISGRVIEQTIISPDHSFTGVNFGRIDRFHEMVSFQLEHISE